MNIADKKNNNQKFFFDRNSFDEEEEVQEEEIPPPPTFSELEMEKAKEEAFKQGKELAAKEHKESREQFIAEQLAVIAGNFSMLQEQEKDRNALCEREAINLIRAILEKLCPAVNEKYGFDEMMAVIEQTLHTIKDKSKILIEVPEGCGSEIENRLSTINSFQTENLVIEVKENSAISIGSCSMKWQDGGALRNTGLITSKIHEVIDTQFITSNNEAEKNETGDSESEFTEDGERR